MKEILLFMFTCFTCCCRAQDAELVNYLRQNSAVMEGKIPDSMPVFDDSFYQNQVFLLGESHGVQKGQDLDLALLQHLNRKVGLRYYLAEVDFTKAYFLNQFLETGREELLKAVFTDWVSANQQWANQAFYSKVKAIKAYNHTLPADKQIRFVGIDAIHNTALLARHLEELLAAHQPKAKQLFRPLVASLRANTQDSIILHATKLLENITASEEEYERVLSNSYGPVKHLLTNCAHIDKGRGAMLFENFKAVRTLYGLQQEKLYGLWGFTHILQAKVNAGQIEPFGYKLAKNASLNLKGVVSIACTYVDSKMMFPTAYLPEQWRDDNKAFTDTDKFNHDGPLVMAADVEVLKKVTEANTCTIFNLQAPQSPLKSRPFAISYAPIMPEGQRLYLNEPGKSTADYFQYLILIRNSKATSPLKD